MSDTLNEIFYQMQPNADVQIDNFSHLRCEIRNSQIKIFQVQAIKTPNYFINGYEIP